MKLLKMPKQQKDTFEENRELFFNSYDVYEEQIVLKNTDRVRIERVRYKRAIASRDIDCFLFTYFNEDRTEIFKRLKSDSKDESARRKFLPVIYDYLYDGKDTYVIEEAVNGDTLQERLDRREVYTPQEVVKITIEICLALEALHRRGIIHMDVKPGNIVEKQDESGYKLIDFNASILEEDVKGSREHPYTDGFEAPEHKKLGAACCQTDICSLGKTMYTLLTGKRDFEDVKNHTNFKFGRAVNEVIRKSTEKTVAKRYQTARDMRHELQGKHVTGDLDDEWNQRLLSAEAKVHDVQDELLAAMQQKKELETHVQVLENAAKHQRKKHDSLQERYNGLMKRVKIQSILNVTLLAFLLVSLLLHIF